MLLILAICSAGLGLMYFMHLAPGAAWSVSHPDTGYHFRFADDEHDLDGQRCVCCI